MKKLFLLLLATVAIGMTVNAQTASFMDPSQVLKGASTQNLAKAPKKAASDQTVYYNRPAGGFVSSYLLYYSGNDCVLDRRYYPTIALKPNAEYTFKSVNTSNENWTYSWNVYNSSQDNWYSESSQNLTINSGEGLYEVPVLQALDENENLMKSYQLHGHDNYNAGNVWPAKIHAANNFVEIYNDNEKVVPLFSSKTMVEGGRFDDFGQYGTSPHHPLTYYTGLKAWGSNDENNIDGFWFGKNGGKQDKHVDGIAQAFEKPEHPYILDQVVMIVRELNVAEDCEISCKIYRIADGLPAYQENVSFPEEPGELIATGRAQLSAHQSDWWGDNEYIMFTLYGNDGQVITPTINDAILIALDGYNEPEMDALTNFTAMISDDDQADEGFGELAYIKYKDDSMEEYEWCGLYNFFSSLQMKTGFSIFITTEFSDEEMERTDAPRITWTAEDGILTVTATGNGNVVLNVGNETANGNGSATITVEYNINEGIEVGATAYAQEVGKLASEVVEETIIVNPIQPEQTDAPTINVVEIAEEYVIVHVGGNGTLTVWVNGQEVTLDENGNYKLLADEEQDMIYIVTAIAQETGKEPSETAELTVEVPANKTNTGVSDIASSKQVAGVRYYNAMGQEMNAPCGMTIVVTTYTDGSTVTVKLMK